MEKKTVMTIKKIQALVAAAEKWAASVEGQKAMEDAQERVLATTAFLSAERIVDGQMLRMPHAL